MTAVINRPNVGAQCVGATPLHSWQATMARPNQECSRLSNTPASHALQGCLRNKSVHAWQCCISRPGNLPQLASHGCCGCQLREIVTTERIFALLLGACHAFHCSNQSLRQPQQGISFFYSNHHLFLCSCYIVILWWVVGCLLLSISTSIKILSNQQSCGLFCQNDDAKRDAQQQKKITSTVTKNITGIFGLLLNCSGSVIWTLICFKGLSNDHMENY